jgi:hypothetical protein
VQGLARKAWVVYAGVLTAAIVLGELRHLGGGEPFSLALFANWMVTLVLLVATWGYVLQRPIATPTYWRTAFWIVAFASVLMLVRVGLRSSAALDRVLTLMAFVLPAWYAAWRYSFRSRHLWNR